MLLNKMNGARNLRRLHCIPRLMLDVGSTRSMPLLILLLLSACGGARVVQNYNGEVAQFKSDIEAAMAGVQAKCASEVKSPELDPIRDKVAFNATMLADPRYMVNKNHPNAREKAALLAWGPVREKCAAYYREAAATVHLPPSMPPDQQQNMRAAITRVGDRSLRGGNLLMAMLYDGKMTFGEFNKKRAELRDKLSADYSAWAATFDAQDQAAMMEKAQAAQKQAEAAIAALSIAASVACAAATNRYVQVMCQSATSN